MSRAAGIPGPVTTEYWIGLPSSLDHNAMIPVDQLTSIGSGNCTLRLKRKYIQNFLHVVGKLEDRVSGWLLSTYSFDSAGQLGQCLQCKIPFSINKKSEK